MAKGQAMRVQCQARQAMWGLAVFAITVDGGAHGGKLNANLVFLADNGAVVRTILDGKTAFEA